MGILEKMQLRGWFIVIVVSMSADCWRACLRLDAALTIIVVIIVDNDSSKSKNYKSSNSKTRIVRIVKK